MLFFSALTYASVVSFLPVYAEENGVGNPGLFFTVFSLVMLVSRGPIGALSDRVGRAAVIAPGLVAAAAGLVLLSQSAGFATMLVVAVVYGLGTSAAQPTLMALTIDRAAPHQRGAAMGTFTTAMDLGIGLGSLTWGAVTHAAGFQTMYLLASLMALVALVILVLGIGLRRSPAAAAETSSEG